MVLPLHAVPLLAKIATVAHQIFALQTSLAVLALVLDRIWQVFLVILPLAEIVNAVSKTLAAILPLFLVVAHQDTRGSRILTLVPVPLALPVVLQIAVIQCALVQVFANQEPRNLSLVLLCALPEPVLRQIAVSLGLVLITYVSVVLKGLVSRMLFALRVLRVIVRVFVAPALVFVSKLVVSKIVLLELVREERTRVFNAERFAPNKTAVFALAIAILALEVK